MNKRSVMLFLLLLGIFVSTQYLCFADEQSPSPFAQNLGKGFAFSIYRPGAIQPVVSVRVEQLFQDLRRKGFFRVSLLKEVVAVGVTVDVKDHEQLPPDLMDRVRQMTRSAAKSEVSVRKIMLRLNGGETVLIAEEVFPQGTDVWRFKRGILRTSCGNDPTYFRVASLHFRGEQRGQLSVITDGGESHVLAILKKL